MVKNWSDEDIWGKLRRGGLDYQKLYAAYKAATEHKGQPTVILAKTIKGYGLGHHFEGRNATHQMKKMTLEDLKHFRDSMRIPISDAQLEENPYLPPYYTRASRTRPSSTWSRSAALGGFLPERRTHHVPISLPDDSAYALPKKGSGTQEIATTMAFVRLLKDLLRSKDFGNRIVPIIPDEARTFGLDAFFPTAKIYNPNGQNYTSVDRELLLAYKESPQGQIMHVGINEAGGGRVHRHGHLLLTHGEPLIPVYIFYSMFGFQRTGDAQWAAADQMARGFIMGATAGRTTLTGEGLQHADGHSHLLASTNPATVSYDPPTGTRSPTSCARPGPDVRRQPPRPERHVLHHALQRAARAAGRARASTSRASSAASTASRRAPATDTACSCSRPVSVCRGCSRRSSCCATTGVAADVWSVTSWTELRRDGLAADEHNFLTRSPSRARRTSRRSFATRRPRPR
jgi:pyruvate dehydrogenase E1 component